MQKQKYYVTGMTCISCEKIVQDSISEISFVSVVEVSQKKGELLIEYEGNEKKLFKKIEEKLSSHSYEVSKEKRKYKRFKKSDWIKALLWIFLFYIIYKYLSWIGFTHFFDIDTENMGFGVAFLVGIAASLSSCFVVVGSLVMSFAAKYEAVGSNFQKNIYPHILFHLGRLGSFFFFGALLGLLGNAIQISDNFIFIMSIFIAGVLFWLAFNMLGFLPSFSSLFSSKKRRQNTLWTKLKHSEHKAAPVLLGAVSFFLPCGFTQSMQLFALSSGSLWLGAFTLFFFALGTMPVLFAVGVGTSKGKNKQSPVFQIFVAFLLMIFAYFTFSTAFAMKGFTFGEAEVANKESRDITNFQVVEMIVDYSGYTPNKIYLDAGKRTEWRVNVKEMTGCTNEIMVPSLGIKQKLKKGENIIKLPSLDPGKLSFSCWMGMVRGEFIIK